MSRGKILALAAALAAPLGAGAVDAPHDGSVFDAYRCQSCHMGHGAPGAALTNNSVNSALCDSCHANRGRYGFPWNSSMQAVMGVSGVSHSWSASATNAAAGAAKPDPGAAGTVERALGANLDTGDRLKCSTCHDVHDADTVGGTVHTSVVLGDPIPCDTLCGVGTGDLQLSATPAGARALGYTIQVSGTSQFKISHDGGLTYFGYSGGAWAAGVPTGKPFTPGTPVTLDDNLTTVTFSAAGTFPVGKTWAAFYVSYPFLRAGAAAMCLACHKDRNQSTANVQGTGPHQGTGAAVTPGATVFSHPVGMPMANAASIRDANGNLQTVGDGNVTNDLVTGPGGVVSCTSCHQVHNADSNSLTTDP